MQTAVTGSAWPPCRVSIADRGRAGAEWVLLTSFIRLTFVAVRSLNNCEPDHSQLLTNTFRKATRGRATCQGNLAAKTKPAGLGTVGSTDWNRITPGRAGSDAQSSRTQDWRTNAAPSLMPSAQPAQSPLLSLRLPSPASKLRPVPVCDVSAGSRYR